MKRILWSALFSAVAMIGCGADEPPPSCEEAITHFYSSGCYYKDTTTEQSIELGAMVARCEQLGNTAPSLCRSEFYDWLRCNNAVPDQALTDADCSCAEERSALLNCK